MNYNLVLLSIILVGLASCKKPVEQEFEREAMLGNIASTHIIPEYENLKSELETLAADAATFQVGSTAENLTLVRNQFLDTYLNFQRVKMFNFGPAEDYNLKASLNTYPVDGDKITANITSGSYSLGSAANTDAIGFPAIDFLLYSGTEEEVLERFTTDPNATNAHTYLSDLISKMLNEVSPVLDAWNGSYQTTYIEASGTDVGSSLSLIYNEFIKDIELVKNAKIGIPAGQFSGGETFPTFVEAYYSGNSQILAVENLVALKRLYTGGTGLGFDDYMTFTFENGGTSVTTAEIETQFDVCKTKIEGLGNPFSEDIPTNFGGFSETFQEMKKLVAYTKTDVSAALGILITFSDTDGD